MEALKTDYQLEKERREEELYADFVTMMSVPGSRKTKVTKELMKKYGIHSPSTIYFIRKRMEAKERR